VDTIGTGAPAQPSEGSESLRYGEALFAPFRDAWIAARARFAILAVVGREAADVTVEAYRGNVVLAGEVPTQDGARRAVAAVDRLAGATGVSNRIRVRGAHAPRVGCCDAEIRTAVTGRLRSAPELRDGIIGVDSVYDGVVRLTGASPHAGAIDRAFELALGVPGVRRVINDVVLQPDPAADGDADAA
jgi:hyperosmotically inducible protein